MIHLWLPFVCLSINIFVFSKQQTSSANTGGARHREKMNQGKKSDLKTQNQIHHYLKKLWESSIRLSINLLPLLFMNKLSILFVKCFLYFYVWEFGGKSDSILLVFRYLLSPNQWGPDKVNSDKRHDSDKATWLWDKENCEINCYIGFLKVGQWFAAHSGRRNCILQTS